MSVIQKKAGLGQGQKVYVMLSGGVDSSVAAALLKERGFSAQGGPASGWDVVGIHIKMWSDPEIPCNFKKDRYDAMRAAAHLDIPFATWDLTKEYKKEVVEYMIREYAVGRTPNPDVMCNREVKFGAFFRRAMAEGADFVATGHYVLLRKDKDGCNLLQAKDLNKDQSYFLWTLAREQLKHCLFPIGEYTKPEVRAMARKFGLPTAEKPDSQGICFIGEIDLRMFLKKYIPERRGAVVTTSEKNVGEHDGLSFYTIGQRHGLSIGGGVSYYVAEKNYKMNTLVVAEGPYDEKLFTREVTVRDAHWISGKEPKLPLKCMARIRYRQPLQECTVFYNHSEPSGESREQTVSVRDASLTGRLLAVTAALHDLRVLFDEPQRAATPGQSAVFYLGDEMLGGGVIYETSPPC